jgi:hypothetical protein
MYTQYSHHIHPPSTFPHIFLHPTAINTPSRKDMFYSPVLCFCIRKEEEEKNVLV